MMCYYLNVHFQGQSVKKYNFNMTKYSLHYIKSPCHLGLMLKAIPSVHSIIQR